MKFVLKYHRPIASPTIRIPGAWLVDTFEACCPSAQALWTDNFATTGMDGNLYLTIMRTDFEEQDSIKDIPIAFCPSCGAHVVFEKPLADSSACLMEALRPTNRFLAAMKRDEEAA